MKKVILLACIWTLSSNSVAAETAKAKEMPLKESVKSVEPIETIAEPPISPFLSRDYRAQSHWTIAVNLTPFEMWVPYKYGVTLGYNADAYRAWEFDYMRASINFGIFGFSFGGIKEERFSLLTRSFGERNSFNFSYGIYYNKLQVHLGDKMLAKLAASDQLYAEVVNIDTLGLSWAIGNRWQTGHFVWAFDWFGLNIPVLVVKENVPFLDYATDESDRDDARTALDVLEHIPAFLAFKLQLGVSW